MALPEPPTETTQPLRTRGYKAAPLRATRHRLAQVPVTFTIAPCLLAATGMVLGILDAHWLWRPPLVSLVGAILAIGLTLFAIRYADRVVLFSLLLLWFSMGQFCARIAPVYSPSPEIFQFADGLERTVTGAVSAIHSPRVKKSTRLFETEEETEQTEQIDLSLDHVEAFTADQDWQAPVRGGLRLTIYARPGQYLPGVNCGERLKIPLRFHVPERYLDPGAWDYPAYLAQHGIAVLASTDTKAVQVESVNGPATFACMATAAQTWAAGRLDQITSVGVEHSLPAWLQLTPEDSAVLSAMLFGDRVRLQHAMRTAFERTGSFHLLVVSGLHITIVVGLIFCFACRLRFGQAGATVLALLLALPYAFLTGFAPPVQRALWLSGVYLVSRILYRERAALNAISIAALGVLVKSPSALFDASFQMTFLAVLVIGGVAAPWIEATLMPYLRGMRLPRQISLDPYLPPRVTQLRISLRMLVAGLRPLIGLRMAWQLPFGTVRWALRFAEAMIVALTVELAMVLPMAIYFHRITLVALPANLIGLPLLGLLLPLALLTFLLGCIHPILAVPSGTLTALLLHAISWLIHLFGNLSVSGIRTSDPANWSLYVFAAVWISALWMVRLSSRWRMAGLTAVCIGSLLVLWPARPAIHKGVLEVTALDVGQGDSILVVTPDGRTMLVDAGGPIGGPRNGDSQFDIGEDVVSQYLWQRHIRRLDVVALTHAHSDHMGGMPAVLQNFRPKVLWVGNNPMVPEYGALLSQADDEKIPVQKMIAGESFAFGNTQVRVLAPASTYQPGVRASNDDSLVVQVRYQKTSALLEGDAEAPVEERMVATESLTSDLLKVGHHGSKTSTTPEFLSAVHPMYAVISVGRRNPFGHPRMSVLDELAEAHVKVYRTDTLGLSSFLLNGTTVEPLR